MRVIIPNILLSLVLSFVSTNANVPPDMTALIDETVQPCDNYYKYACGKWLKMHKNSATKMDLAMDKIEENRRKVLDKVVLEKQPHLRYVWDSCMSLSDQKRDGKSSTDPGTQALVQDLDRISRVTSHREVMKLAGEFSRSGTFAFIEHSVQAGGEKYETYRLYIRPAKLTLHGTKYRDMHHPYSSNPHYKYIEELFKVALKDQPRLSKHLDGPDTVIDMEKKLQNIKGQNLGDEQPLFYAMAVKRWPTTVGAFLEGMGSKKISHTYAIYFEDLEYFYRLETMIKTLKLNEVKSLVAFALIHSRAPWLGDDFVRVWDEKLRGTTQSVDRHQFCQDRLVELLPGVVGNSFTKLAFDNSRKTYAKDIVDLIKEAMERHIEKSKWMVKDDINKAKDKLAKMKTMIAEPPNTVSITNYLYRDNYYKNVKNILEYKYHQELLSISRSVERQAWPQSPARAEAKYEFHTNSVLFPTAMLQPPFFHGNEDDGNEDHPARDFGAMGTIMGREISRGFDKTGSQYEGLGKKFDWWSDATKMKFNQASMCMLDQHSSFESHEQKGDAVESSKQNIADARGLILAWEAYKFYVVGNHGASRALPQEGDKEFFLSFAQSMCSHIPRGLPSRSGEYAPPEWRVNGALMNLDQFHTVYGCKSPQKMIPKRKCELW